LYVREVMQTGILALHGTTVLGDIVNSQQWQAQRLLPIVDEDNRLLGVVTSEDIRKWAEQNGGVSRRTVSELTRTDAVSVYSDETLRIIVYRMAESGLTRMPVVDRDDGKLRGMVALDAVLKARTRHLEEERRREQTLGWRQFIGSPFESAKADSQK
jgi:CIC family chloride channel protein